MRTQPLIFAAAVVLALGYAWLGGAGPEPVWPRPVQAPPPTPGGRPPNLETATFAAGCFWCTEADFDKVPGVVATVSGYTGGRVVNPSYQQVSRGTTGHTEAVEVTFDPQVVTYEQLLDHYWRNVDPFVAHRQFCDVGEQYRPAIFVRNTRQRTAAEASKARMQAGSPRPVVVAIVDAGPFYRAERYHQDYHMKNPIRYRYYRWSCGRDERLHAIRAETR